MGRPTALLTHGWGPWRGFFYVFAIALKRANILFQAYRDTQQHVYMVRALHVFLGFLLLLVPTALSISLLCPAQTFHGLLSFDTIMNDEK